MLSHAIAAALMGFAETALALGGAPAPLHGALLAPDDPPQAIAVILAGSGPTDRNGNNPQGLRTDTYRLLAEGLAERGIATVRADKRGIAESTEAGPAEPDLRFDAYVEDARAWAAEAAERTGQRCAWLIGHSEGALVAEAATAEDDGAICGLVLVSGAGRPARALLEEQLTALPEPLKTQAYDALAELEAGRTVPDTPPQLAALLRPSVQPYLISWMALDPAALIADYDGPVMIGQGTTDLQVSMADAEALAAAQPNARFVTWEGVNHILKAAPAERAANLATYADPSLPLGPGIVDDVADFILEPR